MKLRVFLIGLGVATAARAAPPTLEEIGPAPDWNQAVQLGNHAILARLIDPDSARIAWPNAFIGGSLKALFGKTRAGWYTCGLVNARNRMGGFTGATPFLILIHDGAVVSLDIGEVGGEDTATVTCNDLAKKGAFQPSGAGDNPVPVASAATPAVPSAQMIEQAAAAGAANAAKQGGIGVSFISTPAGLVLLAVAPGSPAAGAGLRTGQVIQSVNGIDLRGMPQAAAIAVVHGLPKQIRFEVVGSGTVALTRP